MNIKKVKRIILKQREQQLLEDKITEEYLIERINDGEKERRPALDALQKTIKEIEKQINFLKR